MVTASPVLCDVEPLRLTEPVGVKMALDCGGTPLTVKFTAPVNPDVAVTVTE